MPLQAQEYIGRCTGDHIHWEDLSIHVSIIPSAGRWDSFLSILVSRSFYILQED